MFMMLIKGTVLILLWVIIGFFVLYAYNEFF